MRRSVVFLLVLLTGIFMAAGIASPASKRPATVAELPLYKGADRQQILEEGAKKEGALLLYTSGIVNQAVRPITDAFQKKYPYIKVDIWRGTSEMVAKILEEYRHEKYLCDVVDGVQTTQMTLQAAGVPAPFYSPNLAYIQAGSITKAPGGGAFAVGFRQDGLGLGYNTKLIAKEQVPKTYRDLLDPKWKGKSAITAGNVTGISWMGTMLTTYGDDFVRQVAKQNFSVHMVSAMALRDMIINGEYMFSPMIFDAHVIFGQSKGAPLEWLPLEPVYVNLGQIAMPKHAPHPHAALLFMDFELSKEGAEIQKKIGNSPTRQDVAGVGKTYKKSYGATSMAELAKWTELYHTLFVKK